ncbi:MAG: iron complex outermembrane receptor protein, partial [Candidatus Azotimanducaceae bacterium]
DGNDIDTAPRNMGSGNIQWRMNAASQVELEWVHMGEYFQDPANNHTYSGHDLINLRFSVDVNEDWQLFGRVMNLTNTAYAERADFAFGNDRYFVGQPISVYVGVRAGL